MNRAYYVASLDFVSSSIPPYRLVLCKNHAKWFKWNCKHVYSKAVEGCAPKKWYPRKCEWTDEKCLWCEYPEIFEKCVDGYSWTDAIRKRKMEECKHEWRVLYWGKLPDGRIIVKDTCKRFCGAKRDREVEENDPFFHRVQERLKENKIVPNGAFCLNCQYFNVESSRCCHQFKNHLNPPNGTCHSFKKRNVNTPH